MIRKRELDRVPPGRAHAEQLLAQADHHLQAALTVLPIDATGAYQLIYDAARKSLAAVLEVQGLRATSRGGHVAVLAATSAQFDPPHGDILRPFDRLRRRRNQAEYPAADSPPLGAGEVERDLPKVHAIVALATALLDQVDPF
jgi:hypothetical protein